MTENYHKQYSNKTQEVIQRDQAWAKAHLDLDLDVISEIASEDYRQRQADGTYIGKHELLTSLGSGKRYWEIAKSTDHHIQVDNDLAIVIGRWLGKGINNGEQFDYSARFFSIYKLEAESWKMILDVSIPED